MAGPVSPPVSIADRESSRSDDFCLSGPWHLKQFSASVGRTRNSKNRKSSPSGPAALVELGHANKPTHRAARRIAGRFDIGMGKIAVPEGCRWERRQAGKKPIVTKRARHGNVSMANRTRVYSYLRIQDAATGKLIAGPGASSEHLMRIGHTLLALLIALLGGRLSRTLHAGENRRQTDTPAERSRKQAQPAQ